MKSNVLNLSFLKGDFRVEHEFEAVFITLLLFSGIPMCNDVSLLEAELCMLREYMLSFSYVNLLFELSIILKRFNFLLFYLLFFSFGSYENLFDFVPIPYTLIK